MLMNLTIILLVLDLTLWSHFNVSESDTLFWRGSSCVSRFEFMTIQPEYSNAQLYALGLSSKTDVHGFDSKLLCLSYDILTLCCIMCTVVYIPFLNPHPLMNLPQPLLHDVHSS